MKKIPLIVIFLSCFCFVNFSWGNDLDLKEIKKLADNGYVDAQLTLGLKYLLGNGVYKDSDEAMSWFRKAAIQGNAEAQYYLEHMSDEQNNSLTETDSKRQLMALNENARSELQDMEQRNLSILTSLRAEEHENFSRIVFEFHSVAKFKDPKITDKGEFSILFLNSSTNLPLKTSYETDSAHKVQSIELIKNDSNLSANVKLMFPDFLLKTFSISNPDYVIVDAYRLLASTTDDVQNTSLNNGALSQLSQKPETKEIQGAKLDTTKDKMRPDRYTVYLHYSREENKKQMEELSIFLINKGFEVDGMERVKYKNRDIRYFHTEDKAGAILLKKYITQFITSYTHLKNTNIKIFNLSHKYPNAKNGSLELWMTF